MHENFAPAVFFLFLWWMAQKQKNIHSFLHCQLGGGFKYFWNFHPYLGKTSNLTHIFQMGWFNHPPAKFFVGYFNGPNGKSLTPSPPEVEKKST